MSHKSSYKWIFNSQVKEFSDLGKDKESFSYLKEHGQCGQMVSKLLTMMELEVFKLMVCIHLLLSNANKKLSLLDYFSEILTLNHQFLHIMMTMLQAL